MGWVIIEAGGAGAGAGTGKLVTSTTICPTAGSETGASALRSGSGVTGSIGLTGGGGVKKAGAVSAGTGGEMGRGCSGREAGVGISTLVVVWGRAGAGAEAGSDFAPGREIGAIAWAGAFATGGSASAVAEAARDD